MAIDRALAGLVEGQLAGEVRRHLAVADRAGGRAALGEALVEQPLHLVDEPVVEHLLDPLLDPLVQGRPVDVDADLDAGGSTYSSLRQAGA